MSQQSRVRLQWKARILAGEVILCALCHEPIPAKATGKNKISRGGKGGISVDHIIPRSLGGRANKENLQPTHNLCNNRRGNKILKNSGGLTV